jgi:O-antigen/teichoic acid export membrane protein
MAVASSSSKEEIAQTLVGNDDFIKNVAQKLAEKLAGNEEFIERICTPEFTSALKPEVAKLLSEEKQRWVRLSLALAIVSLVIMGVVYWLSLWLGGAKAIEQLAVPLISAFCLVVLVINVAFNMTVFRVTR